MLRGDLEVAGIPYAVEGPDGPLYVDFHSLRHSYLTLGGRAGIDLRTLQELAGHSTPVLTARYSHRRLYDLAGAVEKLPRFLPTEADDVDTVRLAATGTDGVGFGCSLVAQPAASSGHFVAFGGSEGEGEEQSLETTQALASQGLCHRQASPGIVSHQRGRRDSNQQPPDRQSGNHVLRAHFRRVANTL